MDAAPEPQAADPEAGPVTDPSAPAAPRTGARRHVLALAIGILAVLALAVVALAAATQPSARFAPDSPEAAFQDYLNAWDARDFDAAYATFSDRVRKNLAIDDYRRMARDFGYDDSTERRVVLIHADTNADTATLDMRVDQLGGGGVFGAQSVWSREITVSLVRENGSWRLDEAYANLEPLGWYGK